MEPILIFAIDMVWLAVVVILYLCHIGYDMRSRGFSGTYAFTVLHQNEVSIGDYYRKRDEHPVLDDQYENCKMSKLYLYTAIIGLLIVIVLPFALSTI